MKLRHLLVCQCLSVLTLLLPVQFATAASVGDSSDDVLAEARGQTVYFNAWGGSDRINAYLSWAGDELQSQYGVTLNHVKIGDIAEVVGQLEAAKAVGRDADGNVDLMWVNGENFAALKRNKLLFGAVANTLPNSKLVKQSPSITHDFSVAVEGLESPWGGAQFVFIYDSAVTKTPPLWRYLDELHPLLWGKGKSWSSSAEQTRQMLDDGEVDIAISFNPNEATAAVKSGQLADTVRTYVFADGTIGNTHFVTIPYNAKSAAAAMVAANFFISPVAQARKANPDYWGDPTVLDIAAIPVANQADFKSIDLGPWALPLGSGKTLSEPHASWAQALETAWVARYGQ